VVPQGFILLTMQTTTNFKAGILPVHHQCLNCKLGPGYLRPIGDLHIPPKLVDPASKDIQTSASFKTSTDNGK